MTRWREVLLPPKSESSWGREFLRACLLFGCVGFLGVSVSGIVVAVTSFGNPIPRLYARWFPAYDVALRPDWADETRHTKSEPPERGPFETGWSVALGDGFLVVGNTGRAPDVWVGSGLEWRALDRGVWPSVDGERSTALNGSAHSGREGALAADGRRVACATGRLYRVAEIEVFEVDAADAAVRRVARVPLGRDGYACQVGALELEGDTLLVLWSGAREPEYDGGPFGPVVGELLLFDLARLDAGPHSVPSMEGALWEAACLDRGRVLAAGDRGAAIVERADGGWSEPARVGAVQLVGDRRVWWRVAMAEDAAAILGVEYGSRVELQLLRSEVGAWRISHQRALGEEDWRLRGFEDTPRVGLGRPCLVGGALYFGTDSYWIDDSTFGSSDVYRGSPLARVDLETGALSRFPDTTTRLAVAAGFGVALDTDGEFLFVGVPGDHHRSGAMRASGAVHVYELPD